mgnify:CR=1 FL=1
MMKVRGRLTLPTDVDMVEETLKLKERLDADALRDCDGTQMPSELLKTGAKIYATYYTTRKDNEWAKNNPEEVQQEYLITDRITATSWTLSIELMKGFHTQQLKVNTIDEPKRWWEVIDRTTGKVVPVENWFYDEATGDITMDYAEEFTEGESTSGKFKSISLAGFLGRAITDVSKSLINNSNFDIVNFTINRMAKSIAKWIEKELLIGTNKKIEGLQGVTQKVTAKAADKVTADEIIDLQESIPDVYQADAYFIMNKKTRTAIRKLKDGQGNYLLNKDANSRWGYTLFGKDVYTSDAMPEMAAGKRAIYYGDYKGLAVKVSEDVTIDVLRETKARQHVVEVLAFLEMDAKVQNAEMLAALEMAAA